MFFILGSDGAEYGPADVTTIKSWMREGRVVLQTKARRPDSAEWKALADFPEFAEMPPALPPPVPAGGDPVKVDADAYAADLIARAKPLDITGCIGRAWNFYKSDFGPILGVTLLMWLIMGALGLIPFGSMVFSGVCMAGLYYYYLGKMRGQHREMSDMFAGFSRRTGDLIIGALALCGIILACLVPGYLCMFGSVIFMSGNGQHGAPAGMIFGLLLLMAGLLPMLYFSITWAFMFPLIIDKNLGWKDAMKISRRVLHAQFWRFFLMLILVTLIAYLGLLLFIVGILLFIPLPVAAMCHAYEDLCNPPPASGENK